MLTSPKLALKPDCADQRDFYQYYRGRYFAVKTQTDKLLSACVDPNIEAGTAFSVLTFDVATPNHVVSLPMSWAQAQRDCAFGTPVLGNTLLGPHYSYLYNYGYRESIKGIGLNSIEYHVPNATFFCHKYGAKHPDLIAPLEGHNFGTLAELELVWNILNKKYFTFSEAVSLLERGIRIGCPLNKSMGLYFHEGYKDIQLSYKTFDRVGSIKESQGEYRVEVRQDHAWLQPVLSTGLPDYVTVRGDNA